MNLKIAIGVPVVAQWVKNSTRIYERAGLIPGLTWWVKDPALMIHTEPRFSLLTAQRPVNLEMSCWGKE